MKAIMPAVETSNAMQPDNKETIQTINAIAYKDGEFHEVVTARWYMGRSSQASVVYCCIWVHVNGKWYSGKGSAGGYGYHKSSAALQDALDSAGIKLSEAIDGRGDRAVDDAIKAICTALGFKKFHLVRG